MLGLAHHAFGAYDAMLSRFYITSLDKSFWRGLRIENHRKPTEKPPRQDKVCEDKNSSEREDKRYDIVFT